VVWLGACAFRLCVVDVSVEALCDMFGIETCAMNEKSVTAHLASIAWMVSSVADIPARPMCNRHLAEVLQQGLSSAPHDMLRGCLRVRSCAEHCYLVHACM
jgi:hypothetical protein